MSESAECPICQAQPDKWGRVYHGATCPVVSMYMPPIDVTDTKVTVEIILLTRIAAALERIALVLEKKGSE